MERKTQLPLSKSDIQKLEIQNNIPSTIKDHLQN